MVLSRERKIRGEDYVYIKEKEKKASETLEIANSIGYQRQCFTQMILVKIILEILRDGTRYSCNVNNRNKSR